MKGFLRLLTISSTLLLPVAGYSADGNSGKAPAPSSPGGEVTIKSQTDSALSGVVVETMDSGAYTYINLEKDGKKTWVAVPKMEVKVGQEVSLHQGTEMGNFTSKNLSRTFENIIFSPGPVRQGTKENESLQKARMGEITKDSLEGEIKVEKASGPDAYTVGELHKNKDLLDKKNVVVKGKVVKVSPAIMGKNWIHLRDGSGDRAEKSDRLVVTSQDLPAVGDTVTARGTIYKDKDFGAGYRYAVIMEDARISK